MPYKTRLRVPGGRPAGPPKDPRERPVQINVKVPHWYREQIYDHCDEHGMSMHSVIVGAIVAQIKPRKPPKLGDWPPKHYGWVTQEIDDEAEG